MGKASNAFQILDFPFHAHQIVSSQPVEVKENNIDTPTDHFQQGISNVLNNPAQAIIHLHQAEATATGFELVAVYNYLALAYHRLVSSNITRMAEIPLAAETYETATKQILEENIKLEDNINIYCTKAIALASTIPAEEKDESKIAPLLKQMHLSLACTYYIEAQRKLYLCNLPDAICFYKEIIKSIEDAEETEYALVYARIKMRYAVLLTKKNTLTEYPGTIFAELEKKYFANIRKNDKACGGFAIDFYEVYGDYLRKKDLLTSALVHYKKAHEMAIEILGKEDHRTIRLGLKVRQIGFSPPVAIHLGSASQGSYHDSNDSDAKSESVEDKRNFVLRMFDKLKFKQENQPALLPKTQKKSYGALSD